jgi:hypothetical protein
MTTDCDAETIQVDGYDGSSWVSFHNGALSAFGAWVTITASATQVITQVRIRCYNGDGAARYFRVHEIDVEADYNDGTTIHFENYNGKLYASHGNILYKLNATRDGWVELKKFATDITALISSLNSGLYIYLGDSFNYYFISDTLLDNCDVVWDELIDGDVTATADTTDYFKGKASLKLVVAAGCAAGDILATEDITSTDLSSYEAITLYVKSSVSLAAGDIQILLDDTAQCASPVKSLDLPIISADTWTAVKLDIEGASGLTAVISIGVKMVVDKGAFTLRLDEIRALNFSASDSANANWGFQHDSKLFKVNTSGTVEYSTDPYAAAPTWTSAGAITDIADQIEGFVVGRDASGNYVPYAATNSIIKVYDSTTPQWIDTEARLPNHPIGGEGHAYWNGKLYFSYGLGCKEYYPEQGEFLDMGLTERDGLPEEYNGEITKLLGDSGVKGMFAAIDASVTSGNSRSGLYLYDGFGWQCWWADSLLVIDECTDRWDEFIATNVAVLLHSDGYGFGIAMLEAASTGILATEAISSTDLSGYTHIKMMVRSSIDLNSGDLQLLLDDTASCASPLETIDIPALTADEDTTIELTLASPSSDTAIISIGLNMVVDKGAFTFHIDRVEAAAYNRAMNDIIVSPASSGYAVYWDCGGSVFYIDIPRGIENPDKITQSYATSGVLVFPWFDAGNPVADKLAKILTTFANGITTTETVALKYRLDHTYTDLDTGWTTMDTLNTTAESGYNEELFASGAGIAYKAIQFRLDFVTPGSTAKPDIQSLVLYHKKRTGSEKLRVWNVTVICDNYGLTTAKEKVTNLKTAITSTVDVVFSYHPNDASDESYYVTVNCPELFEETGRDYSANYQLQLIES